MEKVIENFHRKLELVSNGCVVWKGSLSEKGYGVFYFHNSRIRAHRFSYQTYKGQLLKSKCIDHICRNRACVNPEHLRQVTFRINALENSRGIAVKNSKKIKCKKNHPLISGNLVKRKDGRRECKKCATKSSMKSRARKLLVT